MTKSQEVECEHPILSCIISYDSTLAILVLEKDDREVWIEMYSLANCDKTFSEKIGGLKDSYIRCKEVEQNSGGNKYAVVYVDDGKFRLRVFGKEQRDEETIKSEEFDINAALGINDYTMPIQELPDPFCTCSFISDDRIFVQLFYNYKFTHYHFIYNHVTRSIEGDVYSTVMKCSKQNFPVKSFFNPEENVIYSFYRHGQVFNINGDNITELSYERMTEMDLGQMYLINNKALVVRSSSKILFFKIEEELDLNRKPVMKWMQYNMINARGSIYFIKGNKRIQITCDDRIYFYLIDPKTFEPTLENVMANYMGCTQMMFGSRVRYGITYKTN